MEYYMLYVNRKNELKFQFEHHFAYKHSCFLHNSKILC
jgi:hypothetical protein